MDHGLGEKIVEPAIVGAICTGFADLKERFDFGPADRNVAHPSRGQDARAPGGVIGIERTGEMNAAQRGRPLAGDDPVPYHAQRADGGGSGGIALQRFNLTDEFGEIGGAVLDRHGTNSLGTSVAFADGA
ncbi:hypothetical protein BN961_01076 [Afipia felis]|uniref:Uncharacterized protein n=1 Tax=Afipia felis TaxID=1035 RepID=A0A090MJN7_AFIFE|nr:hypothetical protein BN961_01076 [Afipia felis]